MTEFNARGARFSYPESWTLADESSDEKIQVTAQSPGSAFWTLVVVPEAPSLESIVASVETAYREDYPDGDIYPRVESDGPQGRTVHTRVEFVCLDLVVSARAQAFQIGERTVLVLAQAADIELEAMAPVFAAMTTSLQIDDDPAWPPSLFGD